MECRFEEGMYSGYPVLFFRGDFDSAVCPEFDARIEAMGAGDHKCVVLDLLDVAYTEARPLQSILAAHQSMISNGKVLAVVCCAPMVDKLVQLAGVDEHVTLFHSLDAAATYLDGVC